MTLFILQNHVLEKFKQFLKSKWLYIQNIFLAWIG